jgi:MOSC domain-containing protein YiiM
MGTLLGIATRERSKGPMKLHERARITKASGVEDDFRGRSPGRSVVVLTREGWDAACRDLGQSLDWTTRRANIFVEGVNLTDQTGERLRVGEVVLEITGECDPCHRMESSIAGLRAALETDWRAGATCVVISEGTVVQGDEVTLERACKDDK